MPDTHEIEKFKSGIVAVIGRPNVGKSTLVNQMLQFPLSITTPKPQTTRHRILGVQSKENAQLVFLDTPGLIDPKYTLQKRMVGAAISAVRDADVILVLTDAKEKPGSHHHPVFALMEEHRKPTVLAINKIDLVDKGSLLPLVDHYSKHYKFVDIVPISALKDENLDELEKVLLSHIPYGHPFYPTDMITEHPERFFVGELIREQLFINFSHEIPFSTAVVIEDFKEKPGRKDYIKARIIVERDSQKKIIIGAKGSALRKIGQEARKKIEGFLNRPVYLELFVAVREKWRKQDMFLKEFGYDQRS